MPGRAVAVGRPVNAARGVQVDHNTVFVEGRLPDRVEALAHEFADDPLVGKIIAFVRAGSNRPLMRPRTRGNADATAVAESEEAN